MHSQNRISCDDKVGAAWSLPSYQPSQLGTKNSEQVALRRCEGSSIERLGGGCVLRQQEILYQKLVDVALADYWFCIG